MAYRVIDYNGTWYPEKQSSQGVWQILANCKSKEEAEAVVKREQEAENG